MRLFLSAVFAGSLLATGATGVFAQTVPCPSDGGSAPPIAAPQPVANAVPTRNLPPIEAAPQPLQSQTGNATSSNREAHQDRAALGRASPANPGELRGSSPLDGDRQFSTVGTDAGDRCSELVRAGIAASSIGSRGSARAGPDRPAGAISRAPAKTTRIAAQADRSLGKNDQAAGGPSWKRVRGSANYKSMLPLWKLVPSKQPNAIKNWPTASTT